MPTAGTYSTRTSGLRWVGVQGTGRGADLNDRPSSSSKWTQSSLPAWRRATDVGGRARGNAGGGSTGVVGLRAHAQWQPYNNGQCAGQQLTSCGQAECRSCS
jgi:hypothetical protein